MSRIHNRNERHFPSIFRARLMNIRHIELSARLPFHSQWFFFDRNNAGARFISSVRNGAGRNSRLVLFRWCVCTSIPSILIEGRHVDVRHCDGLVSFSFTKIGLSNLRRQNWTRTHFLLELCFRFRGWKNSSTIIIYCIAHVLTFVLFYYHHSNWFFLVYLFLVINNRIDKICAIFKYYGYK